MPNDSQQWHDDDDTSEQQQSNHDDEVIVTQSSSNHQQQPFEEEQDDNQNNSNEILSNTINHPEQVTTSSATTESSDVIVQHHNGRIIPSNNFSELIHNNNNTNSVVQPLQTTATQRLTNLLFNNNRGDQQSIADIRRQAQSIALELIRILFTSSIKITIFLEYYLLVIGCLSFILLVALHTLFCIPPNNYLHSQQRIDYTRNVIINSTSSEANVLQFTKMMKIFASEQAQNTTKHFPLLFRLGLFGQDYHGLNQQQVLLNQTTATTSAADIEILLTIPNATLKVQVEASDSLGSSSSGDNTSSILMNNQNDSTSVVNNSTQQLVDENNSSDKTTPQQMTSTDNDTTTVPTTAPIDENVIPSDRSDNDDKEDDDDIFNIIIQYIEKSTTNLFNNIIKPINQFFDKRFYSKPRINCLQNTILQKFRDELINKYENNETQVSPLATHSYLLRTYIEGPIDKTMKSWKRELNISNNESNNTDQLSAINSLSDQSNNNNNEDDLNYSLINSLKYWLLEMYESSPGISETFNDTRLFVYSTERGLFYISRESKQTLQIPVYTINLDWNESCFDAFGGLLPYVLSYFIGYDTIMFNTFIQYNYDFNHDYTVNSGMFYTKQFDEVYYLKHVEFDHDFMTRMLAKVSPLILYIVCFILIYYLVRTTQLNILHLIIELQMHLSSVNQILRSFTTNLFQNIMFIPVLLGVIGFIDNFFGGDQKISLMVFCLIWLSQIFLNNIVGSRFSKSVFPWILHFHCGVYLTYYFRYPTGYSYLGFFVCLVLVSEMMLHFWNNYEYHHIMNFHPILRDFLGNRENADPMLFDRLLQQNGIPILGGGQQQQQQRVQNVQQFVINLSDMQNQRTTIEQQIGRFNISISLAQQPNNNNNGNTTASTTAAAGATTTSPTPTQQ